VSEAILFDRDHVERLDDLDDRPRRLNRGKLLWVDVDRESEYDADEVAEAFGLDPRTRDCLANSADRPVFSDFGRYIHVTTYAPAEEDQGELIALECVVSEHWVVTAHNDPIPVLQDFADRVSGSGDTGSLDGPGFLAALLEWVLGAYTAAFERIEQRLEEFDIQAMRGEGDADHDIERLIAMRKQVGRMRRALAAHRTALVSLTHPELEALGDNRSGERFQSLLTRFESTVQEARDAREAIVGSFDVLIARDGHRTNKIMKVLTLTSVILLPGALIAGVMGMNFKVGFFDRAVLFWVVVAVIVAIAPLTIVGAKRRQWI
jgi:Mg2+ and Co2+ transporter CorA